MPFTTTLPTQHDIDEVISDMKLMASGATLYFAVDAFEVVDFCFPIDLDSMRPADTRTIASDQAALWEIFDKRPARPILIPDYEKELQKHLGFVHHMADDVYRRIAMIDVLLGEGVVEGLSNPDESTEVLLDMVENNFNLLLAGVMGMLSIGVDRFRKVVTERIVRPRDFASIDPQLKLATDSYRPSHLVTDVYQHLVKHIEHARLPQDETERRKRSAINDARAVDWVLHMNRALEKAFLEKLADRRIVILYLSSAPRTERIFSLRLVRELFPVIAGRRHNPWRRRSHILEYLIGRELEPGTPEDLDNTIKNLEKQKDLLRRLESFGANAARTDHPCETCVLEGGAGVNCALVELCQEEQKRIDKIPNLGLVAEAQEYERLLAAKPQSKRHQELLAFFGEVLHRPNLPDLALARMKALQNIVIAEASLVDSPDGGENHGKPDEKANSAPRARYLPIKPKVPSEAYAELVDRIFEVPFLAPSPESKNYKAEYAKLVAPIYDRFQELDRASRDSGEHELVRCLTYMTFPNTQGDLVALEYARKKRTHYPDYERDFMYIMAWAASRIQKYQDAHDSATEAIAKWADDPRFYHARSVNTIRWLMDAKYCRVCPLRYSHAIEDAQRAADLLMLQDGIDLYVIANNYNNVAYFSSLSPQTKEYNLKRALDAMEKVNALIPEARWLPEHPEYVHTKANLVLQELRANGTAQKPPSEVVREVDHWIESLEKTIAILNNDVYRETRTELVKLRKQFAVAAAKP